MDKINTAYRTKKNYERLRRNRESGDREILFRKLKQKANIQSEAKPQR